MREPKPIQYDVRIEKMRNRHIALMRRNRTKYGKAKTQEERTKLHEQYNEMKKDLIEFDSWFLDAKFREVESEFEGNSKNIYVCMETGCGYRNKAVAVEKSGLKKIQFEEKLLSPFSPGGCNWRLVQERYVS